eukprot:14466418-Alexandrium_andersonii.AAC.1
MCIRDSARGGRRRPTSLPNGLSAPPDHLKGLSFASSHAAGVVADLAQRVLWLQPGAAEAE